MTSRLQDVAKAIDAGATPPAVVEKAYRLLHKLFKHELPDGPIMRDGQHVLDKRHLFFYLVLEFTVSQIVHAFDVVDKAINITEEDT